MKAAAIVFLSLLISCAGAKVSYDYDTQQDFSKYKTYNYYPELNTGLSQLDDKRLISATDKVLAGKGLQKSDTPQLYINFKSNTYQEQRSNSRIGLGIGNGPINVGSSFPLNGPDQRIQLTVDLVDVATDDLVWQAKIDDTQNSKQTPESRAGFFNVLIEKVFAKWGDQ